jgi:hypothetical protein
MSDRHKALRLTGSGLKSVTIATKDIANADKTLTFQTSNIFVDIYLNFGPVSLCNFEGAAPLVLENHNFRPHVSIYSFSDDQVILNSYPQSSAATNLDLFASVHEVNCKDSLIYANVTLERSLYDKNGNVKYQYYERRDQIKVGKVLDCDSLLGANGCEECDLSGFGCAKCEDGRVYDLRTHKCELSCTTVSDV